MRYMSVVILILSTDALAQSAFTTCHQMGNYTNCQSTYTPAPQVTQPVQQPYPAAGFSEGLRQGMEYRRRRDQIDFETQQMLREAELSRVRAKQVVRNDPATLRRTPTVPSKATEDSSTNEDTEHTANLRTMITQVDACVRLSKGSSLDANDCIDRLKLTDPVFARTWAQSGHIVRLPPVSAAAKP